MAVSRLSLLLVLVACGDEAVVIVPLIDGPSDVDATVLPDLDAITLSVAHEGDPEDIVAQTFTRGEVIELVGVPFADDLVIHMSGRIGASEVAYGRTCSFRLSPTDQPSPHLFFSRSVKFAALELTPRSRSGGQALTYHDGSGLLVAGDTAVIERFDPRTGEYSEVTEVAPRSRAVATELGVVDPRIALIGGVDNGAGAGFVELVEVDSPPERRVERVADDRMARIDLTATTLTDGRIVVIGGRTPPSGVPSGVIVEVREGAAGMPDIRDLRAVLAHPRAGHTATRLGNDVGAPVLIVGGVDTAGPVAIAELFKPLGEELANPATFSPTMVFPRSQHRAALMPDGSVLVIGGVDVNNLPVRTLELFSIDAGFVAVGDLPMKAGVIDLSATRLPDGRILIAGGRLPNGPPLGTAHIARLDPLDGSVTVVATDELAVPRAGHQSTLLCDGTVLLAGGTTDPSIAERYNPPALSRR